MQDDHIGQTYTAGADLSSATAAEGYVLVRSGANVILGTDGTIATGQCAVGVLKKGGGNTSGLRVSVVSMGRCQAKAGDTLTRATHQWLTWNATGRLVAAAEGDIIIAKWVDSGEDAAAAAGDWITVDVIGPVPYADVGTIGGSTGVTDNVLLRADGVGGATVQGGSLWTGSDTGALSTVAAAGGVVVGNAALDAAAAIQIDSTTRGFLPPRQTTAQRTAIGAPVEGLVVHDTDLDSLFTYANGAWQRLVGGGTGAADNVILRADGVGGGLAQGGGVATLSDAGVLADLTGLTLASGNITLTAGGATVDGRDLDSMIQGALGAVDNVVPRSDGAGGLTLQNSLLVIDDAGAATGLTGLTMTGDIVLSSGGATVDGLDLDTAIRGALGATDNIILRSDGAGGVTAQGGGVATLSDAGEIGALTGIAAGAASTNAAAILDITSTTRGAAIPRMTTAQKNAIGAPIEGLLVWDTDLNTLCQYSGAAWVSMIQGALGATDNIIVRVDGATGSIVQGGGVATLSDAGVLADLTGLTLASGNITLTAGGATVDGRDLTVDGAIIDSLRIPAVTHGGEAGGGAAANEFRVSVQVQDGNGNNVAAVERIHFRSFLATMVEAVVGEITITRITGSGVSTDVQAALVVDTDATGLAVVDVLDVSGVLVANVFLETTICNQNAVQVALTTLNYT